MRKFLSELPPALARQVYIRFGLMLASMILTMVVAAYFRQPYLYFPCLVFYIVMIVNSVSLIYNCIKGNYIRLEGVCTNVELTAIKKKTKSIEIKVEDGILLFPVNKKIKRINQGDTVIVYLSDKTPLYEKDGTYIVYQYYAMEIKERNYEFTKRKID